jgi:hypothetical protein
MTGDEKKRHMGRVIAITLAILYDEFPDEKTLDVKLIHEQASPGTLSSDPAYIEYETTFNTIELLTKAGFIEHLGSTLAADTFNCARLSLNGLHLLQKVPEELKAKGDERALGDALEETLRGGVQEAGKEGIKYLLVEAAAKAAPYAAPALNAITGLFS